MVVDQYENKPWKWPFQGENSQISLKIYLVLHDIFSDFWFDETMFVVELFGVFFAT